MKTPREILLQRHQAVTPKLDEIRRAVVANLKECPAAHEQSLPVAVALKLWRELVWPCRRTWAGLAATWLVLVVFNFTHAERTKDVATKSTTPAEEMRLAFQEQQRLLAELVGPPPVAPPAESPRRQKHQPRSERRVEISTV
ncbi:MAG: hypothetical protein HY298_12560 [Verrucomicrobia bacterium]|nr:hypothetical protein [Verrucomicrobiota bacterium]